MISNRPSDDPTLIMSLITPLCAFLVRYDDSNKYGDRILFGRSGHFRGLGESDVYPGRLRTSYYQRLQDNNMLSSMFLEKRTTTMLMLRFVQPKET